MTYASDTRIQQRYFPNAASFPSDSTVTSTIHADRMTEIDDYINSVINNTTGSNVTDTYKLLSQAAVKLYGMILDGKPMELPDREQKRLISRHGNVALVTANHYERELNTDGR